MKIIASSETRGVYSLDLDKQGKIENLKHLAELNEAKYFSIYNDIIYSIFKGERSGYAMIDINTGDTKEYEFEDETSSHILVNDGIVYMCNYDLGYFSIIENGNVKKIQLGEDSKPSQAYAYNERLYVSVTGLDTIFVYDIKNDHKQIDKIELRPLTGPAHIAINEEYIYILCEENNWIYTYKISEGGYKEIDGFGIDLENESSPSSIKYFDGSLFVLIHGEDLLLQFDLVNSVPNTCHVSLSYGKESQDIEIANKNILIANKKSNKLTVIDLELSKVMDVDIENICCIKAYK